MKWKGESLSPYLFLQRSAVIKSSLGLFLCIRTLLDEIKLRNMLICRLSVNRSTRGHLVASLPYLKVRVYK